MRGNTVRGVCLMTIRQAWRGECNKETKNSSPAALIFVIK